MDAIIITALTAEEAYEKAPADYGIVEDITDEDNAPRDYRGRILERTFAVFKTTTDRDLWLNQK